MHAATLRRDVTPPPTKNLTDLSGIPWAHRDTLKEGDQLKADGGFTCIAEGAVLVVERESPTDDEDLGGLFVRCRDGAHMLCGQVNEDGALTGFYCVCPKG